MIHRTLSAVACAVLLASGVVNAAPVTSLSGSTTYTFPLEDYFGTGPKAVAPGITWSSSNSFSVFGYDNGYGFNTNGFWSSGLSMIGTNDGGSTMWLAFAGPISGVGAFLNYAPGFGTAVIGVHDASMNLLESTTLSFLTGGGTNSGEFHGFSRSAADIRYMSFTGAYIGAANLEVVAGTVPEPTSFALLGLGLLGATTWGRRRKQ